MLQETIREIQETSNARESEWQIKFEQFQNSASSIQAHHKKLEDILNKYDCQFEAVQALVGTLGDKSVYRDAQSHPYPFLPFFKEFQKINSSMEQSLKGLQVKYTEVTQKLQTTSKELETQISVLDATSTDKHRLLQQFQDLEKNREIILSDLNKAQKELTESQSREAGLKKKLQRIIQVYATQVEPDLKLF